MPSVFEGVVNARENENSSKNLLEENRLSHHQKVKEDGPYGDEIEADH
jgi:hypothetical protein